MELHIAIEANRLEKWMWYPSKPFKHNNTIFETYFFYNLHIKFKIFSLHNKNVKIITDADKPDEVRH
jgi:hypothetical protein